MAEKKPDWDAQISKRIAEFKNRKKYDRLTAEALKEIPEDKLVQAIYDFIDLKVAKRRNKEAEILKSLSEGFRAIHATWGIEAEVNNGGFNQYFWNSSGQYASAAVEGFRLIGASELADLTKRAITLWDDEKATQQKFKDRGALEAFSESYQHSKLHDLDKEFYAAAKDLDVRRIKFIRSHPELFVSE